MRALPRSLAALCFVVVCVDRAHSQVHAPSTTGAESFTIPAYVDFDSLPVNANVSDIRTVFDLRNVRIPLYDASTGRIEEVHVLDIAYVRREGRVLLRDYVAVRQDDALTEYHLPGMPGDEPVTLLSDVDRSRENFILMAALPDEGKELDAMLESASIEQRRFEHEARTSPLTGDEDLEALGRLALAWMEQQDALRVRVLESNYFTDESGSLRQGRFVGELLHGNLPVRLTLRGGGPGGGPSVLPNLGNFCFTIPVATCKAACGTGCLPAPGCGCSGGGTGCNPATVKVCPKATGSCPSRGGLGCSWQLTGVIETGSFFVASEMACRCG